MQQISYQTSKSLHTQTNTIYIINTDKLFTVHVQDTCFKLLIAIKHNIIHRGKWKNIAIKTKN